VFARRTQWNLQTNPLTNALESRRRSGKPILDLTASNPTECGFAYETRQILRSLASPESLTYEPVPFGLLSARQQVAHYYAAKGIAVAPERILLATSTSEAYSYLFRLLCDPGDEVLVPRPSYPLFDLLADVQDVQLRPYNLFYDHGWHLDLHSLEQQLTSRTRAVMVVSPNNPTGSYLGGGSADALEEFCAAHDLAIVADEVFHDYPLEAVRRKSWAMRQKALTFTLSGLSKVAGLPQLKLAWTVIAGPEQLAQQAEKRLEIIADTYLSVNAPIQHALSELLAHAPALQQQIIARCRENLESLRNAVRGTACSLLQVEAGWYAVLRIPLTQTDEEFAVHLLQEDGVLVHPGHFFHFTRDGYIVVSLLTRTETFQTGIARLLNRCTA
jgi:alanine-synthesizing transaminase